MDALDPFKAYANLQEFMELVAGFLTGSWARPLSCGRSSSSDTGTTGVRTALSFATPEKFGTRDLITPLGSPIGFEKVSFLK